jgi:hypothetical protein
VGAGGGQSAKGLYILAGEVGRRLGTRIAIRHSGRQKEVTTMHVRSFLLDLLRILAAVWNFLRQPTTRSGLRATGAALQFAAGWL